MKIFGQLLRYGIVGLASNLIGYFLYLGLTHTSLGPKTAMSLLYIIGVVQTFLFNKKWTFKNSDSHHRVFFRYCLTYGLGYVVNLGALILLVDRLKWPHQAVQGAMILILAIMLFLIQKFWVFKTLPKI